jgi:hypothetical protein
LRCHGRCEFRARFWPSMPSCFFLPPRNWTGTSVPFWLARACWG